MESELSKLGRIKREFEIFKCGRILLLTKFETFEKNKTIGDILEIICYKRID